MPNNWRTRSVDEPGSPDTRWNGEQTLGNYAGPDDYRQGQYIICRSEHPESHSYGVGRA